MQRQTSWFKTLFPIKSSVDSFLRNTTTASNRSWERSPRRVSFRLNTNCFQSSIFELLRNCRLLERALEYHNKETSNAKGNYWGRDNPVGAGHVISRHWRSAERKANHGSGRNPDPYSNDRFHRYHETKSGVSVHSKSGDKSAGRRCRGGTERRDRLWQARGGFLVWQI